MDYGKLYLDAQANAARLLLLGPSDVGLSDRVRAGQRTTRGHERCGVVEVCRDGSALAQLFATNVPSGELSLLVRTAPAGTASFSAVWAGAETRESADHPARACGFVRVRARDGTGLADSTIAELGGDAAQLGGRVRVRDADRPDERFAILEVDRSGPILYMTDGERSITITPSGIQQNPDKGGALADALPDLGGVLGVGQAPNLRRQDVPEQELAFVAAHPEDPALQIHYNVLEGPEVGVYARGTATLTAGRATVLLPDHFHHVVSETGLTVQLTPRSERSKGVAACGVSTRALEIAELFGGRGEYGVDWVVHGFRRGRERFQVIRPARPVQVRAAAVRGGDGAPRRPATVGERVD